MCEKESDRLRYYPADYVLPYKTLQFEHTEYSKIFSYNFSLSYIFIQDGMALSLKIEYSPKTTDNEILIYFQNAVSMYCRLGFAKKKGAELNDDDLHPSWIHIKPQSKK